MSTKTKKKTAGAKKLAKKRAASKKSTSKVKENPNRGITRIDQPEKRNHGYFVRLQRDGHRFSAFFSDKKHGGKRKALEEARKAFAKMLKEHPPVSRRELAERKLKTKGAGGTIPGVSHTVTRSKGRTYEFWQAAWSPEPNVRKCVKFSVNKYGARKAKQLAIEARRDGIQDMAE